MSSETKGPVMEISAPSLDECRRKLYELYGNDYEIREKKIDLKGGFLGFFQKEVVTVRYIEKNRQDPFSRRPYGAQTESDRFVSSRNEVLEALRPSGGTENMLQIAKLSRQIEELKNDMKDSLQEVSNAALSKEDHKNVARIRSILSENEFSPTYINRIIAKIHSEFSVDDLEDFEKMQRCVVTWIGEDILIAPPVRERYPKVIIIVGPTGVGKTTTIAKLAAAVIVKSRKNSPELPPPKIRMITTDSMRVGAVEQIKNWGETMEIPVEQAERASDLASLYEQYKNTSDYIFVDTSGYSPNDFEQIAKMHSLLDVKGLEANVYLAFSATAKTSDIENIIRNYEQFDYRGIIITKCDETSSLGNVISVLAEKGKRAAFLTDGQNVMHTISRAEKIRLLGTINGFNVDKDYLDAKFPKDLSDNLI